MSTRSKLSYADENSVAAAYMCGGPIDAICEQFGISTATVATNIPKRLADTNNSSVRKYIAAGRGEKDRNFAHFFRNHFYPDYDLEELMNATRLLGSEIIDPTTDEILRRTALKTYFAAKDNYAHFINRVFGEIDVEERVFQYLEAAFEPERVKQSDFSLTKAIDDICEEIQEGIREGGLAWTPYKKSLVNEQVASLPEKRAEVIRQRYGLEGYEPRKTRVETAQLLGCSADAVGYAENLGLRQLRHPAHSGILLKLRGIFTDEQARVFVAEENLRQEEYQQIMQESSTIVTRQTPIAHLDFSTRALNALANGGIETIEDLESCDERELLKMYGFGENSLKNVKDILAEHGRELKK